MEWAEGEGIFPPFWLSFLYYRMVAKTGSKRDKERNQFPSGVHKGDRHQERADKEPDRGGGNRRSGSDIAGWDTVSINGFSPMTNEDQISDSQVAGTILPPLLIPFFQPTIVCL